MSDIKVLLALPGDSIKWATVQAIIRTISECDGSYELQQVPFGGPNGWMNHNAAWITGLTSMRTQGFTHLAMLHADVEPMPGWLNKMVATMRRRPEFGLLSAPIAIKDDKGLLSCGIGDTADPWWPFRRLTNYENGRLPAVAVENDLYALWKLSPSKLQRCGRFLLHNNGCWIADMRLKNWDREVDLGEGNGSGVPCFSWTMKIGVIRDEQGNVTDRCIRANPEDFSFSRMAYLAGIKTAICTDVQTWHWLGNVRFSSHLVVRPGQPMGQWKFDHVVGHEDALTAEEKATKRSEESWFKGVEA